MVMKNHDHNIRRLKSIFHLKNTCQCRTRTISYKNPLFSRNASCHYCSIFIGNFFERIDN